MTKEFNYPFTRMNEEKKTDSFTVRVNPEERDWLNNAKKDLDIGGDSTTLKILAKVGLNVLHTTFGAKRTRYLFKKDRKRLSDYINFE